MKIAACTGINGQDGSHLAELLLSKNYKVIGLSRRGCVNTKERIDHLLDNENFEYIEGDVNDFSCIQLLLKNKPDEFYNLAAMSHVQNSFTEPIYVCQTNLIGVVNILESIRLFSPATRFYQASTSEEFGSSVDKITECQNEDTVCHPESPYAIAKLAAHHFIKLYRKAYGLHCSAGILFNHEGPRRGEMFVSRKISLFCARLHILGYTGKLKLGNLDSYRDWGFAGDYVEAMWLMLQQDEPDDYVISTGETHSVREFCDKCFGLIGKDYRDFVEIDSKYIRPSEVNYLRGDHFKSTEKLGWKPKTHFSELVQMMLASDIELVKRSR